MKTKSISFQNNGILSIDDNTANFFVMVLGSFLIAILAQISISVPFSPVPITGQTIGVVLVGAVLGARRGSISVLAYIMQGALGLPVFAGFKAGPQVLLGPTAGYIWGFVIAAFLIGYLAEKGFTIEPVKCLLSCFVATTLILVLGTLYLGIFNLGIEQALILGFYPFLVGDIIKSTICASIILAIKKV